MSTHEFRPGMPGTESTPAAESGWVGPKSEMDGIGWILLCEVLRMNDSSWFDWIWFDLIYMFWFDFMWFDWIWFGFISFDFIAFIFDWQIDWLIDNDEEELYMWVL